MSTAASARKVTVATAWLDGCSGCHMSFLDMDERLIDLAKRVEIVYSPLVDAKELPEQVDVGILEGSISNSDDLDKAAASTQLPESAPPTWQRSRTAANFSAAEPPLIFR